MTMLDEALKPFSPTPRRYPLVHGVGPLNATTYGPWRIYYDPPPIPARACDWHWVHDDYDGAPDASDNRGGSESSFVACLNACDDWEDGQ